MRLRVVSSECLGCGICVPECTLNAIEIVNGVAVISNMCIGCLACTEVCPGEAIAKPRHAVRLAAAVRR